MKSPPGMEHLDRFKLHKRQHLGTSIDSDTIWNTCSDLLPRAAVKGLHSLKLGIENDSALT